MYNNFEKYLPQEKPRKQFKNPSFSSLLLDQVFHSIDKDNNQAKCNSFSDNDSMSFTTSSSSSSDFSFSSVHSLSSAEYSSVSYKSSKPKPRTKVCDYHDPPMSKNTENLMIKSKSRAMKIYSNLKKMKQPNSPCGKLSSFINALFTNENSKKMKGVNKNDARSSRSSTPSLPRSCLSKNSEAKTDDMKRRNVRFCHVSSMILDDDLYPFGHGSNVEVRGWQKVKEHDEFVEEVDDEDGFSECSEDLFEIDHLGLFGNDRFCDELPVYGTTHVNRRCIIH